MYVPSVQLHHSEYYFLAPVYTWCNLQTWLSGNEGQYQGASCLSQVS
jgi:hypothetical protein